MPVGNNLFKTFIAGIFLGVVAAAASLYAYPAVDQHRETSIVSVAANGGNVESFHANIPMDRIMLGVPGQTKPIPATLQWPTDQKLSDVRVELFKIRNAQNTVIGIAARTAANDTSTDVIDWVLHLPARGSIFVSMQPTELEGRYRQGELRAGSREFAAMTGSMRERWMPDTSGEEDAPQGRIELTTTYVLDQEASR